MGRVVGAVVEQQGSTAACCYTVILDRRVAIQTALASAGTNDVVLVAGKGHETYQLEAGEMREFSDRREVAAALGIELAVEAPSTRRVA